MLLLISMTSLFIVSSSLPAEQTTSADVPISESELNYLLKYNYLPEVSNSVAAEININNDVAKLFNAISNMQKFFNLTVTGHMNAETSAVMVKARCGVPDIQIKFMSDYNTMGHKWGKKHITWNVKLYTNRVTQQELRDAITYSLNVWAEVSGLSFQYKSSGAVDMEIGFYKKTHLNERTASAFDGPNGVLAHAYFPVKNSRYAGHTHMDDDENWAVKRTSREYTKKSLAVVFVHEFGHALGLKHEPDVSDSIMRPIYSGWAEKVVLSKDDIAGIQSLYGKPYTGGATTTLTTPKSRSGFCDGNGMDASVEHNRASLLLFKGDEVKNVYLSGMRRTYKIKSVFNGTLNKYAKIDAAVKTTIKYKVFRYNGRYYYRITGSNTMYLFQGSKVHSFQFNSKTHIYDEKRVDYISSKFRGLPNNIDAAFTWSRDKKLYFLKGNYYYRVREVNNKFQVDAGYPRRSYRWRGMPTNMDAAMYISKIGITLFSKADKYYIFNHYSYRLRRGYPRNVEVDLLGCSSSRLTDSSDVPEFSLSNIVDDPKEIPDINKLQEKYNGTMIEIREPTIDDESMTTQPPKESGASQLTYTLVPVILVLCGLSF